MGMTSQAQWNGLGFAPFSSPEWPASLGQERWGSFVTEWATEMHQEECRQTPRRPVQCEVLMTDPGWWETENPLPIRGECLNMSDDGLYAVVPIGYGLAIGQRYLFHLRPSDGRGDHVSQHGTIVRTEMVLGHDEDRLGIGVKLAASIS